MQPKELPSSPPSTDVVRTVVLVKHGRNIGHTFAVAAVHEVIEAFRLAPSNAERGAKFEQLMVRYFELDPMLAATYERVWRWMDWPDRPGPDTGIDLVARRRDDGELCAIQCKFYEPTHTPVGVGAAVSEGWDPMEPAPTHERPSRSCR